ncbi:MAG TPA: ubiquinol-cytochrome c reductase iron-sulfur subunit [Solirubrobacteraceae bacterium]|jgi:Rieske Fe-S protein|nr:ubiquinol-cytochrome c reductase iron-sulfur subunit [Solirubrobacteraceae bacterium]
MKSKYTADRQMPGSFEGETVTRRRFMNVVAQGSGAVATAAIALPALGFAIGPIFSRLPWKWQPIGPPSDFTASNYTTKVITIVENIGEAGDSIAYVRTRNPSIDTQPENQYNRWVALSSRCAHLGCPVRFVAAAARFVCPCHGGVYDFTGQVVGGPPVRPLDRFFTRLNTGSGLVEVGPRYSVNDQLQAFSPRDPAQPLNGIGQYLYPARFDTAKGPHLP